MKSPCLVLGALAASAALSSAASAQSSVTVFGQIDQGVFKGNGGTATHPGGVGTSKAWTMSQASTSRIGFRGIEDLAGGLSAQFEIEHRFNPDTGAVNSANSFWNGRSYVQLSDIDRGSIYIGREYTPAYWIQRKSDPFGNDGAGQAGSAALWGDYATPDVVGNGTRASNSVGYKSPSLGGFTMNAAVGLSEATGLGRVQGLNVEYNAGAIYAGLGYEQVSGGSNDRCGVLNLAVHYNLGVVKPILYFARGRTDANGHTKASAFMLGATAPLGPGLLKAMYYKVDSDANSRDRSKFGFGYNYSLSKRTTLYADLGLAKQTNLTSSSVYALGMKHTF